ncbi:sterol desaturase family protein [Pedobacter sp. MR2016-24]|uniref:sterol desaturase family protein n=1 Tax=Pedobacter sp. MR2016-24 TaxID=2994466 RepID=UPI0022487139|nr:sterol desaturase family protein [Pedobacter sp. MR2016-24]MCX2485659.1 sterol desaturase family protein [Pedobacter sp. MR2016-24]
MNILINIGIVLLTFCLMECVTWLTHKYIMHGLFWNLHEDHHNKSDHFFEKNDYFFVIFAFISMTFFVTGTFVTDLGFMFYIGIGITLYGFAYFFVHDIFIHQRFKLFTRTDNFYFRALRKAHKVHHKHLNKEEGECFGMLFVPLRYFREAIKMKKPQKQDLPLT